MCRMVDRPISCQNENEMASHQRPATSPSPQAPSTSRRPSSPLRIVLGAITRPLSDGLNLCEHLVAGAVASGVSVAATHPIDTVKTVLQSARSSVNPKDIFSTLRMGGIPALYNGLPVSLGGQMPAGAIKFATFETLTQLAGKMLPKRAGTAAVDFSCAALAFLCCSVVMVPAELLKQRLQAGMYPGFQAGVRTILKQEGPFALYTGYRATLLRDVPYTMLELGLYSQLKKMIRVLRKKSTLSSREEIFLGGVAGGCTGFLTTPLDLAKTRLMTQAPASGAAGYSGVVDVLVKVGRAKGVGGLFKGSAARMAWLIPSTAVYFGVHEAAKRALKKRKLRPVTASRPKKE